MTPTTASVVEGDSVVVCVMSNTTSARLITVTLSTMNGTATSKRKIKVEYVDASLVLCL